MSTFSPDYMKDNPPFSKSKVSLESTNTLLDIDILAGCSAFEFEFNE